MALYAGLMSGTSVDGVEAVLLEISGQQFQVRAATHTQYPALLAARLQAAIANPSTCDLNELGELDAAVGDVFADAAMGLLKFAGFSAHQVRAIGSHGQTLLHRPRGAPAFTLQIGDANRIAERTGVDVVADFRRRDVAAGGEGAPLVPAFHAAAFGGPGARVVANIGGIANITVLGAAGSVTGFDTGPGNCLMDMWSREHLGQPFDQDGAFAASAEVHLELLRRLLTEPYLKRAPPKSTGRELFNRGLLDVAMEGLDVSPAVVQATLCEYTATTVAYGITVIARAQPEEVLVCGGGAWNSELMRRLAARMPDSRVLTTAHRGIAPQHVEAAAFAWLAHQYLEGRPGNLTAVTGARGPRVLGALHAGGVTKA
jgi:anhydro-N-acetylmuramic acid kinase